MIMTRWISTILFLLFATTCLQGQKLGLLLRYNASFGFTQDYLNYNGFEYNYSPGGGIGLELGLEGEVAKGFSANLTIGYQQNLVWHYNNTNGFVNETSFKFNRKFVAVGLKQLIRFTDHVFQGMYIGGGMNYSIPGTFKVTENDWRYGDIDYSPALGFHGDLGFRLRISERKRLYVEPGFRVKIIRMSAKAYESGEVSDLADSFNDLNVSGIEVFSLGLIKKFN